MDSFLSEFKGALSTYRTDLPPQLVAEAKFRRPIGINYMPLPATMSLAMGVPTGSGLLILAVAPQSSAAKADLRVGDVLLKFGTTSVASAADLARVILEAAGPQVLAIKRGSDQLEIALIPD
ncbi:MAG: PDZ domain-containing protein [Burkholderiaceae bacterium]